ncbi:Uncharacterised protein [Shigella sonnei]|nr:Uncharacterised protein [Shigella sonnei]
MMRKNLCALQRQLHSYRWRWCHILRQRIIPEINAREAIMPEPTYRLFHNQANRRLPVSRNTSYTPIAASIFCDHVYRLCGQIANRLLGASGIPQQKHLLFVVVESSCSRKGRRCGRSRVNRTSRHRNRTTRPDYLKRPPQLPKCGDEYHYLSVCCLPLQYFQPCHYVSCRNPMLLSVAFVYFFW